MGAGARGIRTPDQRLRVFVSSTLRELEPERRVIRSVIERLALADRRAFDTLVDDLNLGEATLNVEQDSIAVPGLQLPDTRPE